MMDQTFSIMIYSQILGWITSTSRFTPRNRLLLAGAFLLGVAGYSLFPTIESINTNYYSVLGVARGAEYGELRRGYRDASLRYHPDKYDGDDAQERFNEVRDAFEVLKDEGKRRAYDAWGTTDASDWDDTTKIVKVGMFYLTALVTTILLTTSEKHSAARDGMIFGIFVLFTSEWSIRFSSSRSTYFVQAMTPSEFLDGLRRLLVPAILATRLYSERHFVNMEMVTQLQLRRLDLQLIQVQKELAEIRSRTARKVKVEGEAAPSSAAEEASVSAPIRPGLRPRLSKRRQPTQQQTPPPAPQQPMSFDELSAPFPVVQKKETNVTSWIWLLIFVGSLFSTYISD